MTQTEIYFGALDGAEIKQIKKHLSQLVILPVSAAISETFITLMETYSLSHKLSIPDALIAASALDHEMPLYTLNLKDFRFIPDIELFQPVN